MTTTPFFAEADVKKYLIKIMPPIQYRVEIAIYALFISAVVL